MDERVADRRETAAEVACELFRRESLGRIQHAVPRPIVEVEKGSQILKVHGGIIHHTSNLVI